MDGRFWALLLLMALTVCVWELLKAAARILGSLALVKCALCRKPIREKNYPSHEDGAYHANCLVREMKRDLFKEDRKPFRLC